MCAYILVMTILPKICPHKIGLRAHFPFVFFLNEPVEPVKKNTTS